jgi:hypothetical protein
MQRSASREVHTGGQLCTMRTGCAGGARAGRGRESLNTAQLLVGHAVSGQNAKPGRTQERTTAGAPRSPPPLSAASATAPPCVGVHDTCGTFDRRAGQTLPAATVHVNGTRMCLRRVTCPAGTRRWRRFAAPPACSSARDPGGESSCHTARLGRRAPRVRENY